ncbi:hypothetical protein BDK51DRAFT_46745 [Blyttiomyces helicus]|uniref:Uncharacterized protein n=1 Tax=Blyttiomyces helicus TaxID=388810 RepID=A0A4P9WEQ1_9FUNG|nr:hypothetical protein BDK51DRAFT_46745 [Blyttiomyces helicus]|eukprot:RKO90193.1 hypothetical protein BDK51DRAFT_46745 [Blyttiomyces helicus]
MSSTRRLSTVLPGLKLDPLRGSLVPVDHALPLEIDEGRGSIVLASALKKYTVVGAPAAESEKEGAAAASSSRQTSAGEEGLQVATSSSYVQPPAWDGKTFFERGRKGNGAEDEAVDGSHRWVPPTCSDRPVTSPPFPDAESEALVVDPDATTLGLPLVEPKDPDAVPALLALPGDHAYPDATIVRTKSVQQSQYEYAIQQMEASNAAAYPAVEAPSTETRYGPLDMGARGRRSPGG